MKSDQIIHEFLLEFVIILRGYHARHSGRITNGMLVALVEANRFMSPRTEIEKRFLLWIAGSQECHEDSSKVSGN